MRTARRLVLPFALMSLLVLAPACGDSGGGSTGDQTGSTGDSADTGDTGSGDTGSASKTEVSFSGQLEAFPNLEYDTDWQPADSPIQVRVVVAAAAELTAAADALVGGSSASPEMGGEPGTGDYALTSEFVFQVLMKIEIPGVYSFEGPVSEEADVEFELTGQAVFDPFLIDKSVTAEADLEEPLIISIPLAGIVPPPAEGTLDLAITGSILSTFTGDCARITSTNASYTGDTVTSADLVVTPSVTITVEVPLLPDVEETLEAFGIPVAFDAPAAAMDLGTLDVTPGGGAVGYASMASVGTCGSTGDETGDTGGDTVVDTGDDTGDTGDTGDDTPPPGDLACWEIQSCWADCGDMADDSCFDACTAAGTANAQSEHADLVSCLATWGCVDSLCMVDFCLAETATCLYDGTGSDDCSVVLDCVYSCDLEDLSCTSACLAAATAEAQQAFLAWQLCLTGMCEDSDDPNCLQEAHDGACQDAFTSCAGECEPTCGDAVCGDDGCGGVCGYCASDEVCAAGQCKSSSCQGGCGEYDADKPCQCDSACFNAGDCCADVCDQCTDSLDECAVPLCSDDEVQYGETCISKVTLDPDWEVGFSIAAADCWEAADEGICFAVDATAVVVSIDNNDVESWFCDNKDDLAAVFSAATFEILDDIYGCGFFDGPNVIWSSAVPAGDAGNVCVAYIEHWLSTPLVPLFDLVVDLCTNLPPLAE